MRDCSTYSWTSQDWSEFYPDVNEAIPPNIPPPPTRPSSSSVNMFCDAAHAKYLITQRFTMGIVIFLNGSPIRWYSKAQNTIESSTFGSEFVTLKIAAELNEAIPSANKMILYL